MDFEFSKENILPLPGGRNVHQLGIALQAQTSRECQMELLQQKEQWEELIRTYTGEDPLDNYYKYISWTEQTYPKQGHEGNLVPLLEHCLNKFELDRRYINDRRYCKLWIKYFDLQPNPLEYYHMLKAKGLCTGCTDFYKAWAYYHEAAGDFQGANKVFEEGKRNLAQPFSELESAHQNLIMAAGQHMIFGSNENNLTEKRHALTSLHTYRPGKVSSIRVPSNNGAVTFPSTSSSSRSNNMVVQIHEDVAGEAAAAVPQVPPVSLIAAMKRQEIPKENSLKPGPWTTIPVKKRVIGSIGGSLASGFTVHEDVSEPCRGIRLPKNYPKTCQEDYSDWVVAICYPEPPNPACIPMYPKHRVYGEPNMEYSIEELRSLRYRKSIRFSEPIIDDEEVQFIEEILPEPKPSPQSEIRRRSLQGHITEKPQLVQNIIHQSFSQATNSPQSVLTNSFHKSRDSSSGNQQSRIRNIQSTLQNHQFPGAHLQSPMEKMQSTNASFNSPMASVQPHLQSPVEKMQSTNASFNSPMTSVQPHLQSPVEKMQSTNANFNSPMASVQLAGSCGNFLSPVGNIQSPVANIQSPFQSPMGNQSINRNAALVWPTTTNVWQSPQQKHAPFGIFEQCLEENQPKGSAMKTAFKVLNADELAETGSRGGMDIAVQATDSAQPMPAFSDNSASSTEDAMSEGVIDDYVDTHAFNFNLTAMKVSTPQKVNKGLSIILEESKNGSGSSSSSTSNAKSSQFNKTSKMGTISEEHNSYLAQNLMANAELRSSLGTLMDIPPPPRSVLMEHEECIVPMEEERVTPAPASVAPLNFIPSDPFRSTLINQLLERVAFPGPHTFGFKQIPFIPRLCVSGKKEPIYIEREKYIVEKQLGKGTFGTVYKAIDLGTGAAIAMKYQKPANKWEFYICRELQSRLANHPLRDRFMDIPLAYFGDQASLIISKYIPDGSLLDLANMHKQKSGKTMKECLVIYFCIQMLQIIETMHKVQIIHADIKPDNFLVSVTADNTVELQLIDFGCSIDMSLFPPNATFMRPVTTEDFVCCEMLDGRPWNYHTDLFCIAATAHVLLFDTYIKLQKKDAVWSIQQRFPRYLKVDLWNMFFSSLLNQQTGCADATKIIFMLEGILETLNKDSTSALPSQMRLVVNLLKNR